MVARCGKSPYKGAQGNSGPLLGHTRIQEGAGDGQSLSHGIILPNSDLREGASEFQQRGEAVIPPGS